MGSGGSCHYCKRYNCVCPDNPDLFPKPQETRQEPCLDVSPSSPNIRCSQDLGHAGSHRNAFLREWWGPIHQAPAMLPDTPAPAPSSSSPQEPQKDETPRDEVLVAMLLSYLYRVYDAGGISCGRSWEARLLEPAQRLMDRYRPQTNIETWPSERELIRDAEDRIRRRVRMQFEDPLSVEEPREPHAALIAEIEDWHGCQECDGPVSEPEWKICLPCSLLRRCLLALKGA